MFEFIFSHPIVFNNNFNPIFLVCFTSLSPSFAITLFSSIRGTISEIVPTQTKSKYFKYVSSPKFNFTANA